MPILREIARFFGKGAKSRSGQNIRKIMGTAYEDAMVRLAQMGRKAKWDRDAAEISVRMRVNRLDVQRMLLHMSKEMPLEEARQRLKELSRMKVDKKVLKDIAGIMLKDMKTGVESRVVHEAAMNAVQHVKENPELAEKLREVYLAHRSKTFLKYAGPPV